MNLPLSPPPQKLQQKQTNQESFATIATYSSTRQKPLQSCVTTYTALRRQIGLCDNAINICRSRIIGGSQPINLSNKNIVFNCQGRSSKRTNVNVTFHNIIFANGYSSNISGGVIDIKGG